MTTSPLRKSIGAGRSDLAREKKGCTVTVVGFAIEFAASLDVAVNI
jgi:hypothetical protein